VVSLNLAHPVYATTQTIGLVVTQEQEAQISMTDKWRNAYVSPPDSLARYRPIKSAVFYAALHLSIASQIKIE